MRFHPVVLVTCLSLCAFQSSWAASFDQWLKDQYSFSSGKVLAHISRGDTLPGVVVASPSKRDPDYYYHWIRDAALVMNVVVDFYEDSVAAGDASSAQRHERLVSDFISLSRRNQRTANWSGAPDGLGLGEPKFHVDGSAYDESWGRPQNDGPALRALTLIRWANILMAKGHEDVVRRKLYDSRQPSDTVIKLDLEFVSHHWRDSSFDLWEESMGDHFYTRISQRRALLEGAELALLLNDAGAAQWYRAQASLIEKELNKHWDAKKKYIRATLNRTDGIDYKHSNLDSAVLLGILHTRSVSEQDPFLGFSDQKVAASVDALIQGFQNTFDINSSTQSGTLGVAIGRYPEDRYTGTFTGGLGNPWFLTTNGLAEYYYRLALELSHRGEWLVTKTNRRFLERVLDIQAPAPGTHLLSSHAIFKSLKQALIDRGDAQLRRTRYHSYKGSLSEQFNRHNGFMQGAAELTWSHASFVTAYRARLLALATPVRAK